MPSMFGILLINGIVIHVGEQSKCHSHVGIMVHIQTYDSKVWEVWLLVNSKGMDKGCVENMSHSHLFRPSLPVCKM